MDSTSGNSEKSKTVRLRFLLGTLSSVLFLAVSICGIAWIGVGKWLIKEDTLQPASAIVVLSGNLPTRALEAAALYHQGYAKEIWLTHPDMHTDALKQLGLSYPAEDDFNIRVLRRAGVPAKAIRVLDTPIVNTAEELSVISTEMKNRGDDKVIIVTNKAHTRRVHILWTKYFSGGRQIIAHGLPDDDFVAVHWWKDPGSLSQVSHEVLGIVNAWAGLPVQRVPHPTPEVMADGSSTPQHAAAD